MLLTSSVAIVGRDAKNFCNEMKNDEISRHKVCFVRVWREQNE